MTFLAPMIAIYAAAAAVPLLVLLYFLKLKRRAMAISSTLLWKRAVQDLQVNAPFQRLRRNLLLLLQLLAMLAVLGALSRPVSSLVSGPPRRAVLLIDRSASMNATDANGAATRLDLARKQAKEFVQSLRSRAMFSLQESADQAMVVAFDEHAHVMCNFTSDKKQLDAAIDAVEPSDGPTCIAEAITVAQAFAESPGEATNNRSAQTPAQLELFTDGRISDLDQVAVAAGGVNFHRVGSTGRNLAVTAMQARRSYEKPDEAEVFATVSNFGPEAITTDVQLSIDGAVRSVRSVQVPAAKPAGAGQDKAAAGSMSISFSLTHPQAGVVEVRQMTPDALAADDAAWAMLPAPRNLRTLLVTAGNPALRSALKACPLAELATCTPAELEATDLTVNPPDVVVLDNCAPAKLPRGRYLAFGPPPAASGAAAGGELTNQVVVDWRSRHPVLQFVNLGNLFAAKAWKISLPPEATVLAEFGDGPALALVRREGSTFLLAPFDCMETNWPFEASFVMFCYNATGFLGVESASEQQTSLRVNQAITLEHLPAGALAKVSGPGLTDVPVAVNSAGVLRFPRTARAGAYRVDVPGKGAAWLAVNLLDAAESAIEPAGEITLAGQTIAAQESVGRGSLELWPYLAALGLALVCLEWLVYNLKVRL